MCRRTRSSGHILNLSMVARAAGSRSGRRMPPGSRSLGTSTAGSLRDLNTFYRGESALHELDADPAGFEWVEAHDAARSVYGYLRRPGRGSPLLVLLNWTPDTVRNYRIGVPSGGDWMEILNSDAPLYGGSGQGNLGTVHAAPISAQGRPYLLNVTVPPLALTVFKPSGP